MSSPPEHGPADRHLGDRLAALVDGELSHDSRDRVLAHLATCPGCKAEADAQRALKSAFASTPPPAPSAGLLARLQGLPTTASAPPDGPEGPDAAGPLGRGLGGRALPGGEERPQAERAFALGLLPGGKDRDSLLAPATLDAQRGFRIHETARPHRGHRLAFAAAGAVSLAAFAIGGALSGLGTPSGGTGSPGTVAAGNGAPATSSLRPVSGRSDEESRGPRSQLAALSGSLGPVAPSGQLPPPGMPFLAPDPLSYPATPFSPDPVVVPAVSLLTLAPPTAPASDGTSPTPAPTAPPSVTDGAVSPR
ncbi:anti-sigma factor family protein [Streptomyces avicenniae]|uniref:anti-sigma factor family protein n=1 Tax=Streptomyces avicenniae TaxID=500153 RepID=UPI00069CBD1D|nr:zf-HC2 domain-containing protein [Streptomyces avicenniae]